MAKNVEINYFNGTDYEVLNIQGSNTLIYVIHEYTGVDQNSLVNIYWELNTLLFVFGYTKYYSFSNFNPVGVFYFQQPFFYTLINSGSSGSPAYLQNISWDVTNKNFYMGAVNLNSQQRYIWNNTNQIYNFIFFGYN